MPWMDNFSHFLPQNETNVYLKILNMKQKEIMQDFREGRCNLLVSTSVLVISNLCFFLKGPFLVMN